MKRRHPRTALALLAAVSTVGSALTLSTTPATAAGAAGKVAGTGKVVTGGTPLNARSAPSAGSTRTGTIPNGSTVSIVCRVAGQFISGTVTNTGYWDRLADNSYISDAYVQRRDFPIPKCASATPVPAAVGAWMLPVTAGLISGFRTAGRPTTASTSPRPATPRSGQPPPARSSGWSATSPREAAMWTASPR